MKVMLLKIFSGLANSVDPNQTQGQADMGLHCLHIPLLLHVPSCQKLCYTKALDIYRICPKISICPFYHFFLISKKLLDE